MILPAQIAELLACAKAAAHHAYAPYSRFLVGAAIILHSGEIVSGCNVENASYRLTTCAEQNAITSAVSTYGPSIRLTAVAIHTLNRTASPPCGACRQTIAEFADPHTVILFPAADGQVATCTLADLLPATFSLEKP